MRAATADAPPPVALSPLTVDPCTILTRDVAEAYFGRGPLPEKHLYPDFPQPTCGWEDKEHHYIFLGPAEPGNTFDDLLRFPPVMGSAPVDIPGIADRAARRADGTLVLIQAHGKLVKLHVGDLGPPPDRTDRVEALVRAIVAKL